MVADELWPRVEHAINNFPLMMAGVMAMSAARATGGDAGSDGPARAGAMVRAMVRDRVGQAQLDGATLARVREGLRDDDARQMLDACDLLWRETSCSDGSHTQEATEGAGDRVQLVALTEPHDEASMIALIERVRPGDGAFDAFMQRFMAVAQRIQAIVERPG